jgi:hypothetical protein
MVALLRQSSAVAICQLRATLQQSLIEEYAWLEINDLATQQSDLRAALDPALV